jgi:hypothetical protein
MPTNNPRVQVTLSPSLDALVQSLASHSNASKSQVLRELLEAAEPALRRAVALMDAASQATKEVHSGIARSLDRAQTRIERSMQEAMSQLDATTGDLVAQAEAVRARRPSSRNTHASRAASGAEGVGRALAVGVAAGRAALDPPSSKRGVKSPKRVPGKAGKGGAA